MKVINTEKFIEVIRTENFPKKGELHRIIEQLSFEAPISEIPKEVDKL